MMNTWSRHLTIMLTVLLLTTTLVASAAAQQPTREAVLRVGLVPEHDLFTQKERYQALFDYLADRLGMRIECQVLPHYDRVVDDFIRLQLDAAFFGSLTGAMAISRVGMRPLARPHFVDGLSSYYGVIFVRKQSGIQSADQMRGKTMAFVDRATLAGYLLPLEYFRQNGIEDFTSWFDAHYFTGTHEDSIMEVLKGFADVGAAKSTVFYRMARTNPQILDDLVILASSPHAPANTFGVRSDLPEELVTRLQELLLNLHLSTAGQAVLEQLGVQRFLVTSADDFQPVVDYARGLNIDLNTHPEPYE